MDPESRFIDVDGVSIHVLRWPRPGAPPLLLLHGTGFLADLWRRAVEGLHEHYDVAAVDVRGHGRSARPDQGYGLAEMAGDVPGVFDALGWRDAYVAGHSVGAALAFIVAARRPDLVRRLFAVEPIVPTRFRRTAGSADGSGGGMVDAVRERMRRRRAAFPSRAAVEERWRDRPVFAKWDARVFDDYVQHGFADLDDGSVTLRCPPAIEVQVFESSADFDATPYLRDVRCPVLIAQAERSDPWVAAMIATAAALLADVERITIPGTSHFAPMEAPALVAEEIRAFDAAAR